MQVDRRSFIKSALAFIATATGALDSKLIPAEQVEQVERARDAAIAIVEAFEPGVHFRGGSLGLRLVSDQIAVGRRHPITGLPIGSGPIRGATELDP